MLLIEKVHCFKVGDTIDSNNNETTYSLKDLEEMVETYDVSVHEAPVVYGHEADQAHDRPLSSKSQLANGWIILPYLEGEDLFVDLRVDQDTYKAIKEDKLKKRSLALYPPNFEANPTPGKWYIRHLALLGSEPPAVKGLNDIVIYQEANMDKDEAIKLLNDKSAEWLAFILRDEGDGFGEDITEFVPAPSQENNWLYDEEAQEYKGSLITSADKKFDFVISQTEEGWESEVRPVLDNQETEETMKDEDKKPKDEAAEVTESSETEELKENMEVTEDGEVDETRQRRYEESEDSCPKENMEYNDEMPAEAEEDEELKAMKEELYQLRERLAMKEKADKEKAYSEFKTYCEGMYGSGKMTEGMYPQEKLMYLLKYLYESMSAPEMPMYSEGEGENKVNFNAVDVFKQLLNSLKPVVEFSESVANRTINDPVTKFKVPKNYGKVSEDDAKLYGKMKAYQEANKIPTFAEARRAYLKENG